MEEGTPGRPCPARSAVPTPSGPSGSLSPAVLQTLSQVWVAARPSFCSPRHCFSKRKAEVRCLPVGLPWPGSVSLCP